MKTDGTTTGSIKDPSSQVTHFRDKLARKLGKIESRVTKLTANTLDKIKIRYSVNPLKGTITSPSKDIMKAREAIASASQYLPRTSVE